MSESNYQGLHHGRRLLHQVLDEISKSTPNRLYATVPRSTDLSEGFRDVTFEDMARCSDYLACWLQAKFGRSSDFETLCYIGIPDLRSAAIFLAAVKCGYKVLFPSLRNPPATNLSLIEQTMCSKALYAREVTPIINQLQSLKQSAEFVEVPSFHNILGSRGQTYPYKEELFEDAIHNPIVILHSSGSTGLPKPITMTHGTFAVLDNERNLPKVPGRKNRDFSIWDFSGGGKFYMGFPYFHLAGFLSLIVNPIFTEASIPVLGPPLMPPSGSLLKNVMKEQTLRALYVPPSIAEQLLQEPNGIDLFRGLDFLCYTGGPFSPSAGKRLAEVTELCPLYGSTEAFQVPQLVPSKEDWAFMEWNPNYKLEMRLSEDEKETYELVLFADASTERSSALNHNLPGTKEFRTKDLFKPHPTKPNLWRYYGRRDDIIVLSNSEKFNPVPMELLIQGNPLLAGAVIVGQGRLRAALLVEPKSDAHVHDLASLIEMIWPVVEEANLLAPGQGRILQSMIILASTDKPFTRAGKGMVVRKLTEQSYKSELDDLYSVDSGRTQRTVPILKPTFSRQSVESFVRSVITSCFPAAIGMSSDDDMFAHGLDSLKTAELVDLFKVSLREHSTSTDLSWISMKIIYQYPTIQYLSEAFYDFVNENKVPGRETSTARTERMDALVKVYTKDLCPRRLAANASMDSNGITVALTGSTGFVGQYLLRELLGDVNIFQVFCLNRGIDARQRQKKALSHRGFEDLSKLTYLTVDLGLTRLALSSKEYSVLLNTVDVIIHNAWGVDFNQSIQSFEIPHLRGIRNLIDWSNESKKAPRIVFISSVSSVGNWKTIHPGSTSVPELPVDKYSVALHIGYGESKNVAEHVLNIANQKSQVPVTILRMGQLTGSTRANDEAWPEQEWLSSLIKASKSIAMMPDNVAPLDWLPVDKLAQIVCDIVLSKPTRTSTLVHNLVHPSPSPWSLLLETLYDSFGIVAKTVPLAAWVRELRLAEKHAATNLPSKPALKLLDLFDSLGDGIGGLRYDTEFSITTSKTMAGLKPMTKDLLRDLLKQWQL